MLTSLDFVRFIYGGSAALYLALSALILIQMRLSRTGLLLVLAALASALWLGAVAVALPRPFGGFGGGLDLLRSVAWYAFLLHLYRRSVPGRSQLTQAFIVMGLVAVLVAAATVLVGHPGNPGFALWSAGIALRLGLAVCNILLIENLYFNASADTKWRITLPCIALGALSVYDVALSADAVLLSQISTPLFAGNAIAAAIVVPLLAVSATRNRSWQIDIHVSRTVVFHSATLIAAGVFLLAWPVRARRSATSMPTGAAWPRSAWCSPGSSPSPCCCPPAAPANVSGASSAITFSAIGTTTGRNGCAASTRCRPRMPMWRCIPGSSVPPPGSSTVQVACCCCWSPPRQPIIAGPARGTWRRWHPR